jgi:hypothetical protein
LSLAVWRPASGIRHTLPAFERCRTLFVHHVFATLTLLITIRTLSFGSRAVKLLRDRGTQQI